MNSRNKGHYFQASANAFGGSLDTPFEQIFPVLAPTSLPSVGGYASARHEGFRAGEVISVERVYTQVSGSTAADGTTTTLASSVIEGLNVGNVFFADRIAAQIASEHRENRFFPTVSFLGTEFRGVRIGGCAIEPVLNLGICDTGEREPSHRATENKTLLAYAQGQNESFEKFLEDLPHEERPHHLWAEWYADAETNSPDEVANRGNVVCSIVDTITKASRSCPWRQVGPAIQVPGFGLVYLGELVVSHTSYDLTMVRFDLGCPVSGSVSGAQVNVSGTASVTATAKKKGSGGTTGGPP